MKGQLVAELIFVAAALAAVFYFGERMIADLAADPTVFKLISAILALVIPVTAGIIASRQFGAPRSAIGAWLRRLVWGRER